MGARILIIDDDRELCTLLAEFLQLEGFATSAIHNGAAAVSHCRSHDYDAIVLDIMLPGMQGLEVLASLRKFTATPVLMLTARGEETDRIVGLEMGADDYLPKPCNPRELAARLRAILRRAGRQAEGKTGHENELLVGQTRLNNAERSATYAGTDLKLTSAEFNVLGVLLAEAGTIVDKESLCQLALGRELTAYDRSIDVHISKLRKQLANAGAENPIASGRGSGYQFTVTADEARS
mgnify:FL=1